MSISWELCDYHKAHPEESKSPFGMVNLNEPDPWGAPSGNAQLEVTCEACYENARKAFGPNGEQELKLGEPLFVRYNGEYFEPVKVKPRKRNNESWTRRNKWFPFSR